MSEEGTSTGDISHKPTSVTNENPVEAPSLQPETGDSPQSSSKATVRPSWPGFTSLRNLIVFGDSYSDVGWDLYDNSDMVPLKSTTPTKELPLGIRFPGITYSAGPNWVGHLVTMYKDPQLLVYDYAQGGSVVKNVEIQITQKFLGNDGAGCKPEWAPWKSDDTLFVTWVGINDVCYPWNEAELQQRVKSLANTHSNLYLSHGARNFMFINVPPRSRDSSKSPTPQSLKHEAKIKVWNQALDAAIEEFTRIHPEATTFLFSAWDTFSNVLNDPETYGFTTKDAASYGAIWADHVHPTSAMHEIVAVDIGEYLARQEKVAKR